MRPAFNIFLTYNAGFGFMFGSLKSIFIAVIWIYLSQCIYLLGAEVSAAMRRREAVVIKRLMDGKRPKGVKAERSLLIQAEPGEIILREGEDQGEMYYVRSGTLNIEKAGTVISSVGPGQFFGEMAFLLSKPRSTSVRAGVGVELIRISHDNFNVLTKEFPGIVEDMLQQMAHRLKDTTELVL
jgi:membrane protein